MVRPRFIRAYQDTAFQEAAAAVPVHGTGDRRMLRAELNLSRCVAEDRTNRPSRFFPAARARCWTLQSDIQDQQTLVRFLPEARQTRARQSLQQYEEVRDALTRPHFLRGPKWDGGNRLTRHEMQYLGNLGWLDNELRDDEEAFLIDNCIDGGYATVRKVLAHVLEDGDRLPKYEWSAGVEVPVCKESNCWC
jgi:hypothetical protein